MTGSYVEKRSNAELVVIQKMAQKPKRWLVSAKLSGLSKGDQLPALTRSK